MNFVITSTLLTLKYPSHLVVLASWDPLRWWVYPSWTGNMNCIMALHTMFGFSKSSYLTWVMQVRHDPLIEWAGDLQYAHHPIRLYGSPGDLSIAFHKQEASLCDNGNDSHKRRHPCHNMDIKRHAPSLQDRNADRMIVSWVILTVIKSRKWFNWRRIIAWNANHQIGPMISRIK
jgi:hypothetical protein